MSVCQDHVFLVIVATLHSPAPLLVLIYSLVSAGFFFVVLVVFWFFCFCFLFVWLVGFLDFRDKSFSV